MQRTSKNEIPGYFINWVLIIDIFLLDSHTALQLSFIIISRFFNKNQRKFTGGRENLDRITFVVEEAQSVIGWKTNVAKFVELAKEGRKYQLGGVFITQQPGSISREILSHGDNFFVFPLLIKGDLKALMDSNAQFSNDILTQILNEPIKGKSYMWTSNQPFVLPVNILNFELLTKADNAQQIQTQKDLLSPLFTSITTMDDVEEKIYKKFLEVLQEKKVNISDREKIHIKEINGDICKGLYKKLDDLEKEYLENEDWIAKYDGKPFAISYKYYGEFYDKALSFYHKLDKKWINKMV